MKNQSNGTSICGHKRCVQMPTPLHNIRRVTTIKILGINISNNLSVCGHVNNVIASCAQSIHALRILRAHGIPKNSINMIFKAVIIGNLTHTPPAHGGALPPPTTANGLNPSSDEAFVHDYVLPTRHLWLIWSKMLMTICLTVFCTIMNMS